jgi:hypothetical protein
MLLKRGFSLPAGLAVPVGNCGMGGLGNKKAGRAFVRGLLLFSFLS